MKNVAADGYGQNGSPSENTCVFISLTNKSTKTQAFSSYGADLGMNFNPFSTFLGPVFDVRKIITVSRFCIKVCIWTGKLKPPDKARGDKNIVIYVEIDAGSSKLAPRLFYYLVIDGPRTNPRVQKSNRFVRVFNIFFLISGFLQRRHVHPKPSKCSKTRMFYLVWGSEC